MLGFFKEKIKMSKRTLNPLETKLQKDKEYGTKIIAKKLMHLHIEGKFLKL